MAKTKEQLETELAAANTRVSELEQQLAAGGVADHAACERKLAEVTEAGNELQKSFDNYIERYQALKVEHDAAKGEVDRLSQLIADGASAEFDDGVAIVAKKSCGAAVEGQRIAVVLLSEGIDMNFVVDAVRSGIARVADVPSIEDEQVDADA